MRGIVVLCLLGVVVAACRGAPTAPPPAPTPAPTTGPEAPPAGTPTPTGTALTPTPTPTSIRLPERVAEVDVFFRPLLEEATGQTFIPHQYRFEEEKDREVVRIHYRIVGEVPEDLVKASKRLSDALKAQGASEVSVETSPTKLSIRHFKFETLPYKEGFIEIEFDSREAWLHVSIARP